MADPSRDPHIESHIESIATRAELDVERLIAAMVDRSWPGGGRDRRVPAALAWLRRWGPRGLAPLPPACSCAAGRCSVCN